MKDTTLLTNDQAEHITGLQAKVDLMEHGVIHVAEPLLAELADLAVRDALTVERLRDGVDQFNKLLSRLDYEHRELESVFDYYIRKNAEAEVADNA